MESLLENPTFTVFFCGNGTVDSPGADRFKPLVSSKKKFTGPPPMKTTTCHVCHAGTLAAPFYMKDLGPRHLGHAVGMAHAGTLAAPVPMKFLNM